MKTNFSNNTFTSNAWTAPNRLAAAETETTADLRLAVITAVSGGNCP